MCVLKCGLPTVTSRDSYSLPSWRGTRGARIQIASFHLFPSFLRKEQKFRACRSFAILMASSSGATPRTCPLLEAHLEKFRRFKEFAEEMDDVKWFEATVARVRDAKGLSALHHAAMEGSVETCQFFIHDFKLDVNLKGDKKGETPLLLASLGGHKSTIVYLLKMGGNPDVRDEKGLTPLHHAIDQGNSDIVQLLLSHGVNVDTVSNLGTPLEKAASGMHEIVKILLDHHADPNLSSSRSNTPLSYAVSGNSLQCVKLLLEAGAHPDRAGGSGVTPLLIAVVEGRTEIVRCLLKYGANPDLIGEEGLNPLEIAAIVGNFQCVKILFPVTSPIPSYPVWSIDGVMKHVHSSEMQVKRDLRNEELFSGAKLKGDHAFRDKDYRMAILDYTRAIQGNPLDSVLLSNRSLCWACLKNGEAALSDAMCCIMLKPEWTKGYYRAGAACNILEKFDQAADFFAGGLKLDPKNKELQEAYQEAVGARMDSININM